MKIALGSDHGGFSLKEEIKNHLESKNIEIIDYGTGNTDSCDYSEFSEKVGESVVNGESNFGILVCGTGIGISIAANKIPGIRAAVCSDTFSAHACREHNNANILALGQRTVGTGLALDIVDTFLGATFEGGRHQTRIDKIKKIEEKYSK